jgi:hypothetical protein
MNDLQIAIVTILGAGLVVFAAWLMAFRRESGHSRAKLFGIELELSTPGLVVLAAGCGLLVLPVLVPHRPGGLTLPRIGAAERSGGTGAPRPGPSGDLPWERQLAGEEIEPNEAPSQANRVAVTEVVQGRFDENGEVDYFAVALPEEARGRHRLVVRPIGWQGFQMITAHVWNEREEQLGSTFTTPPGVVSEELEPAQAYLVRVQLTNGTGPTVYELQIRPDE